MDLDEYYAEQDKRMNLPHETIEEYHKRVAALKRKRHMEQHVDLFSAVNAAAHVPPQEIFTTRGPLRFSDVSVTSEQEIESARKRQKLCDQEQVGDYSASMQEAEIAHCHHSLSSVRSGFQPSMPVLQGGAVDSNLNDSILPRSQSEQERNWPHLLIAEFSDDIQDSIHPKSRLTPGQTGEGSMRSWNKQGSIPAAGLGRQLELSHPTDGIQDEIDSFTEDSIILPGSKLIHAVKDTSAAAPEDSPIGDFFMKLRSRDKRRIQEIIPTRRQQRLELHPVDDVSRFLGKKPGHTFDPPTSPIEDVSLVPTTSRTSSRKVIQVDSIHTDSTTRIAKHTIKQDDRPLKRSVDHTRTDDQSAGKVISSAGGPICATSSEFQVHSAVTSESKILKKVNKYTTIKQQKMRSKNVKAQLMTPVEYARMLRGTTAAGCANNDDGHNLKNQKRHMRSVVRFLERKNIFYTGGDMKYATETTRGKMDIIVRFGGNLMPEFDPQITTHVITDANVLPTLRALGVRSLKDIPDHIPTVRWSWILSVLGKESVLSHDEIEKKLRDTWLHAAFSERMDAGYQPEKKVSLASLRDKSRRKIRDEALPHLTSDSKELPIRAPMERSQRAESNIPAVAVEGSTKLPSACSTIVPAESPTTLEDDPLRAFYREVEQLRDEGWSSNLEDSDDAEDIRVQPMRPAKRGWTCDAKEPQIAGGCPNQDIIDKLSELMQLHRAKVGDEDRWRAFTYNKCIRALRSYPKRLESPEEARKIRGIGERTARKIAEILETGDLRRIKYENTEDVVVTRLFQGIYGVGQSTAFQWWAAGCRTLDDLREGKGGVKLNSVQEIGLLYYDDINTRMSREEAKAIFDRIKQIALEIDSNLFVEIMGSYRRRKSTCGDIDILITRPTDDGKTHSGILPLLLEKLHAANIITEDLALPDDPGDLEAIYRGLCVLPSIANAKRRRIDFLCVPWKSRGAALIYYTGDDIFNRAMRLKANVMGFSLNQRGLFGNVVRNPRDKRVKLNDGVLVASETEEEIFKILEVPWQEPHERVRG